MQITFDTSHPDDVAYVKQLLGVLSPAPAFPAITPAPAPASAARSYPLPAGAPAGAHWQEGLGAPMLVAADGSQITIHWDANYNPVLGGIPPMTGPAADAANAAAAAIVASQQGTQPG